MNDVSPPSAFRVPRIDLILAVAIGVLTAALAYVLYTQLSFSITHLDIWFDSDSLFVFDQITNRYSRHNDTNSRHPVFPLLTFPLVFAQSKLLGIARADAALVVLVISSSLCGSAMYAALRLMKRPIGVSLLFTAVFLASTPGLLFLGVYERLIPGALSILLCVIAFLLYERRIISVVWLVVAAAGTLGITITNFILGVAALLLTLGLKRGTQATINAFCLILLMNVVGTIAFPASTSLIDIRAWPMTSTVLTDNQERLAKGGTVWDKALSFGVHAMVLPQPEIETKPAPRSHKRFLSVQKVGLRNHRAIGYVAIALWLLLLGIGAVKSLQRAREKVDVLLGIAIAGQFCLFLVFGAETILYSPYYVPLLILLASKCWTAEWDGKLLTGITLLFLATLGWNNTQVFSESLQMARALRGT